MDEGYQLRVAFPDESPSFVYGFEAGKLWAQMLSGIVAEIEAVTHSENREIISRMAIAEGWDIEQEPTAIGGWDHTKLIKQRAAPDKPNPHGLRVIE